MADSNIAMGYQAPQIQSPLDQMAKVLTLKQLGQQTQMQDQQMQDQQSLRGALKAGMITNPDGTQTFNPQAASRAALSSGAPESIAFAKAMQTYGVDQVKSMNDAARQFAVGVGDEPSYQAMRQHLLSINYPGAQNMPQNFDQKWMDNWNSIHQDFADRIKQQNDAAHINIDQGMLDEKKRENNINQQKYAYEREKSDASDLNDFLDKGWTARSGAAGTVQQKIIAGQAAQQLFAQGKLQKGGLDSRQMEEAAVSTANLLGGGSSAQGTIQALVPHTASGNAQTFKEWIANKPTGQQMQAFADRLEETVNREIGLAQDQKRQFQIEGMPKFQQLRSRNPDTFNRSLSSRGLNYDTMADQNGRFIPPSQRPIETWSDEELDHAVRAHGGLPGGQ